MIPLEFRPAGADAVELRSPAGGLLLRYVFQPATPAAEATRPYAHPVCTLAGEVLTNFRPNDHPWHQGLNFTINNLSGWNFWGGGTYRRGEGYKMRDDHGVQRHAGWVTPPGTTLDQRLDWVAGGQTLLEERRTLTAWLEGGRQWRLRWQSELRNVAGRPLTCANYHSGEGLVGSHYTGLQFRGARDLLDEHGDAAVGILADGGLEGEKAVHGAAASWMEWRGQKDTTLRRVRVRFANATGPVHWFVRRNNPLAAIPFHFDRNLELAPGDALRLDHALTFTDE